MRKILIFANGENNLKEEDIERFLPFYKVICADGGTRFALDMGFIPDIIVGDLDSISEEISKEIENKKIEWRIYPKEKDETDLELAVREALKFSPELIYFVGLLGKRVDHFLSNIFFLERIKKRGVDPWVLDKDLEITLMMGEEEKIFLGNEGEIFSLIPISEEVEGIILRGLKYPLNNESLFRDLTRGISNEFISKEAYVRIKRGTLLVIHFFHW